jgi:hypothetical protein
MVPGHFLGIVRTTGDALTFVIMTDTGIRSTILRCSVIRRRNPKALDLHVDYRNEEEDCLTEEYTTSNNIESNTSESDTAVLIQSNTNHDKVIVENIPRGTQDTGEHSETLTYEGRDDNLQSKTEEIYDHFDIDRKCKNIREILGLNFEESTGKLLVQVEWVNGQESVIDAELIQKDDPL